MNDDETRIERLINQFKSNDVDQRLDALIKLKGECESGVEIKDTDNLLNAIKSCLRTSNQHLTTATLAALPPLLPLLVSHSDRVTSNRPRSPSSSTSSNNMSGFVDSYSLRQVLNALLSSGGVLDRLGDKEKPQLKARETVVILGGLVLRVHGGNIASSKARDKGIDTPLAIFERYMKEGGLGSKVWKVREQSIISLVHIRRMQHQFPIKPYLPLLVGCLEDTDSHVRECARQGVVELFTGPGATDAARADLKKELARKGVRKAIVDDVHSKLLSNSVNSNISSHEGLESSDAATSKTNEYVPPSLILQGRRPTVSSQNSQSSAVSRTASVASTRDISRPESRAGPSQPLVPPPAAENSEVQPLYIASGRDLEHEFSRMAKIFEGKETEHNWAAREQAIIRVRSMLKGDVHVRYLDTFLVSLKDGFLQWSLKTLNSLRTTVAINTTLLYSELAAVLGTSLDPFSDSLLSNLLKMASLTKKLVAQQSQATVNSIITHTSAQPRIVLPLLSNPLQEKAVQVRTYMVAHLKRYLEVHGHKSRLVIEVSNGLETIEKFVKKALSDAHPAVREDARILFWTFESIWPDRGSEVLEGLETSLRKQVEKACPNSDSCRAPTTPKDPKKSNLAAAIAASRAKAKAIATAPPSLRHKATSSSPRKRVASPASSSQPTYVRATSPLGRSSPRISSYGGTLTNTSVPVINSPSRSPERALSTSSVDQHACYRRTSSPLSGVCRYTPRATSPPSPPISVMPRGLSILSDQALPPLKKSRSSFEINVLDNSLLLAQSVPLPSDGSFSEENNAMNLMSFSAALGYSKGNLQSPVQSLSPKSDVSKPTAAVSNALSSGSIGDTIDGQPIVEDALRARAEQAESAAERLLELVEPDEDNPRHSSIPPSLLISSSNVRLISKTKTKPPPIPITDPSKPPPSTPSKRAADVMRQAAMFQDSPVQNKQTSSILDVLEDKKHETGCWLKRKALIAQQLPRPVADVSATAQELNKFISALVDGERALSSLQNLVLLCSGNPAYDSASPTNPDFGLPGSPTPFLFTARSLPSLHPGLWEADKNFERLLNALLEFLQPTREEEEIEYGLILLWQMMENQNRYLEGRESDLFSTLLRVRYANKVNVLEATSVIRDALMTTIEPVYGLTTIHASLRQFHSEPSPATSDDVKAATYAFGLIALGKFILRLPAEVAEEELPRLKATLISALNDKSYLIVRESAAAVIIAAQFVMRDETHLFALLDGLEDEKKNLLTYLFDKHSVRGSTAVDSGGMAKLQKEICRLDTRASTPLKPAVTT